MVDGGLKLSIRKFLHFPSEKVDQKTNAKIQKIRCHQTFNIRIKVQILTLLALFTLFTSK
jgi:hypothetical protein